MRKATCAVLACLPLTANATLIAIDFSGIGYEIPPPVGQEVTPGPAVKVSVILDTAALQSVSYHFGERAGLTCLDGFNTAFGVYSSSVMLGSDLLVGGSGTATFRGDGPPPCNGWFSSLRMTVQDQVFGLSFDLSGEYTLDEFNQSEDPIFDLLQFHTSSTFFTFRQYNLQSDSGPISITKVPEPGSLALFGLGVLLVAGAKKVRSNRSKRSGDAEPSVR